MLISLTLRCQNLGHASIKPLDEVFHAIVAEHLSVHPLTPTLNEQADLPTAPGDWQNSHVWLHKPPLALWQIAVSLKLIGNTLFALRLPSAILATAAAALTGLIAHRLFDPVTAVIAATLQLFNPTLEMLVHGYVFSDHVDISLLFWTELSMWLLLRTHRSGRQRDAVLCGMAQGAAFLSKTFPSLIVIVLAIAICFASGRFFGRRSISGKHVLWIVAGTVLVAGPWNIYAALRWPQEFLTENLGILAHLTRNVEGWQGPWDRLLVDYGWRVFHAFYPALIACLMIAMFVAIRDRSRPLVFVIAWAAAALIPNLLATSKPMTATLVGWPAMWIIVAWGARTAMSGSLGLLAAWVAVTLIPIALHLGVLPVDGWGYPPGYFFGSILLSFWKPVGLGIAAGCVGIPLLRQRWQGFWPPCIVVGSLIICLMLPTNAGSKHGYAIDFWRVSKIQASTPDNAALVAFASKLPARSVLLVSERTKLENKLIAFGCDRDCYPLIDQHWQAAAQTIIARGGLAYVVTDQPVDLPAVWQDPASARWVYACSPASAVGARVADHRDLRE